MTLNINQLIWTDDNFLTLKECDYLLNFFHKNKEKAYKDSWNQTFALSLCSTKDEIIESILKKISNKCNEFTTIPIKLDNPIITFWEAGSYMNKHVDPNDDVFAALVYLNDSYQGGETGFPNFKIQPKFGKCLIFSNSIIEHYVTEISEGERFTLSTWFVKNYAMFYN
jgi:hypothetical protein